MSDQSVMVRADDETAIRDDDLLAQVARASRNSFYPALLRNLVEQQRQRDAERSRKGQLTPVARRREDVRDLIQSNPLSEADRHYIHSVLALCALPYRRPAETSRDFIREYGKSSLVVQSG